MERIKYYWNQRPLAFILVAAFLVRIISILFSKGYGMHDDHFLVIEAAQSWVDGEDYNKWLPKNRKDGAPTGHSWFYVGLHYYFFQFLEFIGILGAQTKLYFVRLLHALWYLMAIRYAFKITLKLDSESTAKMVGLFMAFLWFTPILSVRNLVEVVCLTPLLGATWFLLKTENMTLKNIIFAGLLMGVSVSIRFQTIFFLGGIGLVLLTKSIGKTIGFGLFFLISLFICQIGDVFLWGRPFAEFTEYIAYNLANKTTYAVRPWYMYFGTIGGLLLPPLSLFLYAGWSKVFKKKYLLVLVPSLVFFGFHCYFPNKQERFIIPFLPYFIILGWIGWRQLLSEYASRLGKFDKYGMRFFWGLNSILLLAVTPAYSKKSRVETMEYFKGIDNYQGVYVEHTVGYSSPLLPKYYAGKWFSQIRLKKGLKVSEIIKTNSSLPADIRRNHVVFFEAEELDKRIASFEENCSCSLKPLADFEPSYLDKFVHWLNPVNDNEKAFVYELIYTV
ncbi:hypothetical protein N9E62_00655 [Salibacteraceae bacterium]|nr:hypothetical protein [Salibacteraceae bacterium]